jgi:hypothetical protein
MEKDTWASNRMIYAETHRFSGRCRCANGHPFTAEIHFSINVKTDKELFDRLASTGMVIVQCPTCRADCRIAEPVTLHDPDKEQFALFIPETLTHREIHFRGALLTRIAAMDADRIPPYFGDFQTLIGLPDLIEWRSTSSVPALKRPSYAYDGRPSPHPTTQPSLAPHRTSTGPITSNPPIHEAFADLARSDKEAPSYPPSFPLESDSEDSGDWLDDEALSTAERALSNASDRSPKESGPRSDGDGSENQRPSGTEPKADLNGQKKAIEDGKQSNKKK